MVRSRIDSATGLAAVRAVLTAWADQAPSTRDATAMGGSATPTPSDCEGDIGLGDDTGLGDSGAGSGSGAGEVPSGRSRADLPDRATVRLAVRYTLELLAERSPGYSVEVRIPPFAAVQAVAGPTHRRGTPAAVVEMDAHTWVALAVGQSTWAEAMAAHRIRASGERADLSPWLPLMHLRA